MNKTLQITLTVAGVVLVGALLVYAGFTAGTRARYNDWPGMFSGMMGAGSGMGMMQGADPGYGMMGGGMGMMGGMTGGYGMMGGYASGQVDPLSIHDAEEAVLAYIEDLDIDGLSLGEVMIFENHAYAQIVEGDSGIGAMEVLVDPSSLAVYPEHGPNMMWNLKYNLMGSGMMGGGMGMMGMMNMMGGNGMMDSFAQPTVYEDVSAEMDVSPTEAISLAADYLDEYLPAFEAADEADAFYGYYTLHVLEDGQITGMLSVNGYNGQVFLHTWHGDFVEMAHD